MRRRVVLCVHQFWLMTHVYKRQGRLLIWVFDFRKNVPFLLALTAFWLTCLAFIVGSAAERTGFTGERGFFLIVFLPLLLPGAYLANLLGFSIKTFWTAALFCGLLNGTAIWLVIFPLQKLITGIFARGTEK